MKKQNWIRCILLCIAVIVGSGCQNNTKKAETAEQERKIEETAKQEKQRQKTEVIYDNVYEKEIVSQAEAKKAITQEADRQHQVYDNPEVEKIENKMEEDYDIFQVTLGEMEREMAQKVENAFSYMYETYPVLKGKLTNLTIGNIESGAMAETYYRDFISPPEGIYPIVMKHEIVLNGRDFLNQQRMENIIRKSVSEGHWMKDMNIEAIVVHELGHVLVSEIRMERYGLKNCYYINEENQEAYAAYNTDILKDNQTTAHEIVSNAYENYDKRDSVSIEEACCAISGYASGIQSDGGVSYEETCAEAITDKYLHGENANEFSLQIVAEMERFL